MSAEHTIKQLQRRVSELEHKNAGLRSRIHVIQHVAGTLAPNNQQDAVLAEVFEDMAEDSFSDLTLSQYVFCDPPVLDLNHAERLMAVAVRLKAMVDFRKKWSGK